jgi:hypothetical protein
LDPGARYCPQWSTFPAPCGLRTHGSRFPNLVLESQMISPHVQMGYNPYRDQASWHVPRSRIHKRIISLRFLGIVLRVFRLEGWGFCIDILNHREVWVWFSIKFSSFLLYSVH